MLYIFQLARNCISYLLSPLMEWLMEVLADGAVKTFLYFFSEAVSSVVMCQLCWVEI